MSYLNLISFLGIFGLCGIAWLFSEDRRVVPWRVIGYGIGLQLLLGLLVFRFPLTRDLLDVFNNALNGVFAAAETGANFVFGDQMVPERFGENPPLGYIFAVRALPTVVFFAGLMALLYNVGIIQPITNFFARIFYRLMGLSGAESLSGAANIFVGIEAAIVVKPFLAKMTRSELCAILACCFGTAASSTLAIYVSFLRPVFPNILGHLVSASIMAIPACFVLSKILIPEVEVPLTAGGIPTEEEAIAYQKSQGEAVESAAGEPMQRTSPLDAAILGSLDGVKMAVSIAAVLILILGLVDLVDRLFGFLGSAPGLLGAFFQVVSLRNILGALFYPLTILTGVPWDESWTASVLVGRRLLETAIPPYQSLAELRLEGAIGDRTVLIVSYALSGFAHFASVGIFVGGVAALIPSRRRELGDLGWRALFVGTLATLSIACVAGTFDNGDPSILGVESPQPVPVQTAPPAVVPPPASPEAAPQPAPEVSPLPEPPPEPAPSPEPPPPPAPEPPPTP